MGLSTDIKPFSRSEHQSRCGEWVQYKVHGFWDKCYLKVLREHKLDGSGFEPIEITWGSGGRDRREEPSDKVAAECFARALRDAASYFGDSL